MNQSYRSETLWQHRSGQSNPETDTSEALSPRRRFGWTPSCCGHLISLVAPHPHDREGRSAAAADLSGSCGSFQLTTRNICEREEEIERRICEDWALHAWIWLGTKSDVWVSLMPFEMRCNGILQRFYVHMSCPVCQHSWSKSKNVILEMTWGEVKAICAEVLECVILVIMIWSSLWSLSLIINVTFKALFCKCNGQLLNSTFNSFFYLVKG